MDDDDDDDDGDDDDDDGDDDVMMMMMMVMMMICSRRGLFIKVDLGRDSCLFLSLFQIPLARSHTMLHLHTHIYTYTFLKQNLTDLRPDLLL